MENDLQVKYDSLCYATFMNIKHLTEGAKRIVFKNFDAKNKEHLFALSVATACWSILGERDIAINANFFDCLKLARRYKKICKIHYANGNDEQFIDTVEMLNFMRPTGIDLCGEDFTFGDIYDEYYSGKE